MKCVLLLSGGMDSSTLLAWLLEKGYAVTCISFRYGQRHERELTAAAAVAAHYGVPHEVHELPAALFRGSALTGGCDVPHGRYDDPTMSLTVVPNRNMVFLSLAAAKAVTQGAGYVAYAAHAGDHSIYPDCRPEFVSVMGDALSRGCDVRLLTPFLDKSKGCIAGHARRLGVPLHLTWTCYEGADEPCLVCGACVERGEALS